MAQGEFSSLLKIAQITPNPKITISQSPSNYRPISIFPALS